MSCLDCDGLRLILTLNGVEKNVEQVQGSLKYLVINVNCNIMKQNNQGIMVN